MSKKMKPAQEIGQMDESLRVDLIAHLESVGQDAEAIELLRRLKDAAPEQADQKSQKVK